MNSEDKIMNELVNLTQENHRLKAELEAKEKECERLRRSLMGLLYPIEDEGFETGVMIKLKAYEEAKQALNETNKEE